MGRIESNSPQDTSIISTKPKEPSMGKTLGLAMTKTKGMASKVFNFIRNANHKSWSINGQKLHVPAKEKFSPVSIQLDTLKSHDGPELSAHITSQKDKIDKLIELMDKSVDFLPRNPLDKETQTQPHAGHTQMLFTLRDTLEDVKEKLQKNLSTLENSDNHISSAMEGEVKQLTSQANALFEGVFNIAKTSFGLTDTTLEGFEQRLSSLEKAMNEGEDLDLSLMDETLDLLENFSSSNKEENSMEALEKDLEAVHQQVIADNRKTITDNLRIMGK